MILIDFTEIPAEGDRWTLFAQDFLQHLGFHIERSSYRDAESMYDFCAVEQVPGRFNSYPIRWLVSCRHKAATRTAVKEGEELGVLERILRNKADGFLGFYSTQASPALIQHVSDFKEKSLIKDFRFFDSKFLESQLVSPAFGRIVSRYFPNYAQTRRVAAPVGGEYLPIRCDHCHKDLLETLYSEDHQGVAVRLMRRKSVPDEVKVIADVYTACKGACDERLQTIYCNGTLLSAADWISLSDLVMPPVFLERIISILDQIGKDAVTYSPQALAKEQYLLRALAQRTLRESSNGEIQRAKTLMLDE